LSTESCRSFRTLPHGDDDRNSKHGSSDSRNGCPYPHAIEGLPESHAHAKADATDQYHHDPRALLHLNFILSVEHYRTPGRATQAGAMAGGCDPDYLNAVAKVARVELNATKRA